MRSPRYGPLDCPGNPGGGRSAHPAAPAGSVQERRVAPKRNSVGAWTREAERASARGSLPRQKRLRACRKSHSAPNRFRTNRLPRAACHSREMATPRSYPTLLAIPVAPFQRARREEERLTGERVSRTGVSAFIHPCLKTTAFCASLFLRLAPVKKARGRPRADPSGQRRACHSEAHAISRPVAHGAQLDPPNGPRTTRVAARATSCGIPSLDRAGLAAHFETASRFNGVHPDLRTPIMNPGPARTPWIVRMARSGGDLSFTPQESER